MFSETNEIKKFFIHTALTLKIVLNLVLSMSALFLPIKLSSTLKKQTLKLVVVNNLIDKNSVNTKIKNIEISEN